MNYIAVVEGDGIFALVVAKKVQKLAHPLVEGEPLSPSAFVSSWQIQHAEAVPSMEKLALESELNKVLGVTAVRVGCELLVDIGKRGEVLLRDLRAKFFNPIPCALFGGMVSEYADGINKVSRRELVAALGSLIQSGRVGISDQLPQADNMKRQIEAIRPEAPHVAPNDETQTLPDESFAVAVGLIAWRINQLGELQESVEPISSQPEKPYNPATFGLTE